MDAGEQNKAASYTHYLAHWRQIFKDLPKNGLCYYSWPFKFCPVETLHTPGSQSSKMHILLMRYCMASNFLSLYISWEESKGCFSSLNTGLIEAKPLQCVKSIHSMFMSPVLGSLEVEQHTGI